MRCSQDRAESAADRLRRRDKVLIERRRRRHRCHQNRGLEFSPDQISGRGALLQGVTWRALGAAPL